MMATISYKLIILMTLFPQSLVSAQQLGVQPSDITRYEQERFVFIPCPFDSPFIPSVWRINGMDYTSATLPSIYYLVPSGLFIKKVYKCLNQTSFQCIDTSGSGLRGQESNVGTLTVATTSEAECTRSELESFLQSINQRDIELDHQHIVFVKNYTTLAWNIIPKNCSVRQILSYTPCQQNNPVIYNITTSNKTFTLSSMSFRDQMTGELVDFNISTSLECSHLSDTLRFNITETEIINLLLGNNDCTCVEMDCQGALNVAISNPDPNQLDIVCPVYGNMSYSPERCHGFNDIPFFSIHEISGNLGCKNLNVCFGNISEGLNNSRLDFFVSERTVCVSPLTTYTVRKYTRSFEIRVAAATTTISVNTSSREVCFFSTQNCSLTNFTQYNVSITDFKENLIFSEEDIPEASCVTVGALLSPDHAPLLLSVQPLNEYIQYSPITRAITSDHIALRFINDSPRVNGSTISADVYYNQPIRSLWCTLSGLPYQDCSSGSVIFHPRRGKKKWPHSLMVIAVNTYGWTAIRTSVRSGRGFCRIAQFINQGVLVSGRTATVQFEILGGFESFQCDLDREGFIPCSSPQVYTGLSPGEHRLKVVPCIRGCCRRRIYRRHATVIWFTIR